ncbi:4Fe-4S binding protein [Anaeroselena agilis]|uniref:4Fe-4S binding protein n=1 Tax=Anaeroselena agilis TaxID=3063788 RepID=A0ABU3P2F5_9FIRM|nr:4Fe-4S binding protein [Selenomonadales bacterium 4137-cl]
MIIDKETCIGCQLCQPYCPMGCISYRENEGKCAIDLDECVECGICQRPKVCPTGALQQQELDEMRNLRRTFSNPLVPHKTTSVPGRGTEEMKTNDVTGRFKRGHAGVAVELGRPGTGTRFRDVEKVAMAVAPIGVTFEPQNPVTALMVDTATGKMQDGILDEKVLSAIVEFDVTIEKLAVALTAIKQVAPELDTVFSLDLASRMSADNTVPTAEIARQVGFEPSLNGKTNVGLGRPLAKEV